MKVIVPLGTTDQLNFAIHSIIAFGNRLPTKFYSKQLQTHLSTQTVWEKLVDIIQYNLIVIGLYICNIHLPISEN
jgi:hypothetical protein